MLENVTQLYKYCIRARASRVYLGTNDKANDCLGLAREGRGGQFRKTNTKYRI